jgi:hypothetical protein
VQSSVDFDVAGALANSRAAEQFKADVLQYFTTGSAERIGVRGNPPRVKVMRLLRHVLASHADLDIERISLEGQSGCSDFVGTAQLTTTGGTLDFEFVWCCRWRAEEQGWTDFLGFPDQIRAAREFDWNCFRVWREK